MPNEFEPNQGRIIELEEKLEYEKKKVKQTKRRFTVFLAIGVVLAASMAYVAAYFLVEGQFTDRLSAANEKNDEVAKYFEIKGLVDEKYIGEYDQETLMDGVAAGMISGLGDRWSYYLTADEYVSYLENLNNEYVGIGITIQADDSGSGFAVVSVTAGGPAEQAGIMVGDILLAIDGVSMKEAAISDARQLVRGEVGTGVLLTISRDEQEQEVTVIRGSIAVETVKYQMYGGDVGVITITNFDSGVADKVIAAVDDLIAMGASGLVFDVRNNPGGMQTELLKILDYLLPEGNLFFSRNNEGVEKVYTSDAHCIDMPMAVLVNENSYSAAEFFAAALQEYGWANIVGGQTTGKGRSQTNFRLSDGSAIVISVNEYFTPNHVSLIDIGVTPDYPCDLDEEAYIKLLMGKLELDNDAQFQLAAGLLK